MWLGNPNNVVTWGWPVWLLRVILIWCFLSVSSPGAIWSSDIYLISSLRIVVDKEWMKAKHTFNDVTIGLLWDCFIDKVLLEWVRFVLLLRQPAYRNNQSIHHSCKWSFQLSKGKTKCSYRTTSERTKKTEIQKGKRLYVAGGCWVQH